MTFLSNEYNDVQWDKIVRYDAESETGLRWLVNTKRCNIGDTAGIKRKKYWDLYYNYSFWRCHRIIWILSNGTISRNMVIDHIDGNGYNNKIENLRLTTPAINSRNCSISKHNTTGVNGVSITHHHGVASYVTCRWYDEFGKQHRKHFSIKTLGMDVAMMLAVEKRNNEIARLNEMGFGYSERHLMVDKSKI